MQQLIEKVLNNPRLTWIEQDCLNDALVLLQRNKPIPNLLNNNVQGILEKYV